MEEVKAPDRIPLGYRSIFLGGSINNGAAINWQQNVLNRLQELCNGYGGNHHDILVLNPRREDWRMEWSVSLNHPSLQEQIKWELQAQEIADLRIYFFTPGEGSPITLMELGAFKDKKTWVYCSRNFYRYTNVDVFCKRYGLRLREHCDTRSVAEDIYQFFEIRPKGL